MSRLGILVGAFVVPPLVVALAVRAPATSLVGLALTVAGLLVLRHALLPGLAPAAVDATLLLAFYATSLWRDVVEAAPLAHPTRFLAAALLLMLWRRTGPRPLGAALLALGLVIVSLPVRALPLRPLETLFASRDGLLFWNPVLWVGLVGIGLLARADWRSAVTLVLALVAVVLAHGRFTGTAALPPLVLGLGYAVSALERASARRPEIVLVTLGVGFVAWNALLMAQYRTGLVPADETVSFVRVAENSARLVSESVGTPLAWPANWLFAAQHDVSPAEFDRRAGTRLFTGPGQRSALIEAGDLRSDPVFFSTGWTSPRPCENALCLGVMDTGRLFLSLERPEPLNLVLRLRGQGSALLAVNGVGIGGLVLGERLGERRMRVSAERLRPGLNELTLRSPEGGSVWLDWIACERDAP